jgi:hypothetical protein
VKNQLLFSGRKMSLEAFCAAAEGLFPDVAGALAGSERSVPELSRRISLLELMLKDIRKQQNTHAPLEREAKAEESRLLKLLKKVESDDVMIAVHEAERTKVEKLEHEAMAKLVNRMRDRDELVQSASSIQNVMESLSQDSATIDSEIGSKRQAVVRMQDLLGRIRSTLEKEPQSPDLPPLSEVDPSLLEI